MQTLAMSSNRAASVATDSLATFYPDLVGGCKNIAIIFLEGLS